MRPEARKVGGKVQKVMHEFGSGKLRSSSGQKVTNPKQAIAIALSEQRRAKKYDVGGVVTPEEAAERKRLEESAAKAREEAKRLQSPTPTPAEKDKMKKQLQGQRFARGGAIAKQDTQHGRMDMPFKKLNRFAGMREGGNVESKKMMAKEVAFMKKKGAPKSMLKHEEAEMKGYARGGKIKEVMGPRTMSQDVEGGYKAHKLAHGEHSEQKRGHTRGTVVKMASGGHVRGGGCEMRGKTRGKMV